MGEITAMTIIDYRTRKMILKWSSGNLVVNRIKVAEDHFQLCHTVIAVFNLMWLLPPSMWRTHNLLNTTQREFYSQAMWHGLISLRPVFSSSPSSLDFNIYIHHFLWNKIQCTGCAAGVRIPPGAHFSFPITLRPAHPVAS